jgi:hypothetical protein
MYTHAHLVAAISLALSAGATAQECRPLPHGMRTSGPLTVEQVERSSLVEISAHVGRVPHVPFGLANAAWNEFKAEVRPGDTIHEFTEGHSSGHVLMREGCVVRLLITTAA